ncbi:MAG: hypothetical protein IKM46_02390 [Clostridia bacterium]|nr:hypothetical protein [Clostridia bacterium]
MRILISFMILALICVTMLASCSKGTEESGVAIGGGTAPSTGNDEISDEEKTGWDYFIDVECQYHHKDYHIIPLHLVEYIGIDKAGEWAKSALESLNEEADEMTCRCPDFNIKSFIDTFSVSREDFVTYGDIIYYATYDADLIYSMSEAELGEYYIYSDSLIDDTIVSQHFQFIESHFKYEYYSEMMEMVVYNEELASGIFPSVPTIVQKLNIDRESFEKILDECTARNEAVYGRSFSFDYDLDMIYNPDGSFKALPTFEGMNEFLSEMKLNRIFCGVDE